jgi:hypothetical protein
MKSVVSLSSHSSTQSAIFINKALQLSPQSYTIPTIISKGKGKSKLPLDDDVPLALLKKQRCGYKAPSTSLFDIEVAALFLTKLQHLTPIRGLVYNFLNSPLIETFGRPNEVMPRYPSAAHDFVDHQGLHVPLQSSSIASHKTNQPTPFPMDVQVAIPTSVAVSQSANIASVIAMKVSPSCQFFRATRGRQKSTTVVVENVGM